MTIEQVPWMIGNASAVHSAEVGRSLAYNATNGAEGVTRPRDLQVRATAVTGPAVRIMPGGGSILNRGTGGAGQTYIVRGGNETLVNVPQAGSSGPETHYVIIRIDDPQYGGSASGAQGPYTYPTLVGSISNLNYSFIALARIVMPANEATVLQSYITDLRVVANPRELTVMRIEPSVVGDSGLTLTASATTGEWWPNDSGQQLVTIPDWATRVQLEQEWIAVRFAANSNARGQIWTEFGPFSAPSTRRETTQRFWFDSGAVTNVTRQAVIKAADDVFVPADLRGTEQLFVAKGRLTGGTGVSMDSSSGMVFKARFMEVADPSTS